MMTLSHLAISGLATAAIAGSSDPIVIGVGAMAGLLPDVDITKSPAGRILFPLSQFLEKRFPHRSCTHSILASLVVGSACYGLSYAGWLSHHNAHANDLSSRKLRDWLHLRVSSRSSHQVRRTAILPSLPPLRRPR